MNEYTNKITEISKPNKYTKWYLGIINKAQGRASSKTEANKKMGYSEAHHILPRAFDLGGEDDRTNLAHLSGREHFLCHLLLTKMVDGPRYYQMLNTLALFLKPSKNHSKRNFRMNSWEYEQVKRASAEANKYNMSREVSIDGVLYPSAKEARKATKIPNLHAKLHSTAYPQYFYTDGLTVKIVPKEKKMRYKQSVSIDGVTYESTEEARRVLGLNRTELDTRFRDINYPTYIMEGITKDLDRIPRNQRKKVVIIEGKSYSSITEAYKKLGLKKPCLVGRLKSKHWPDWNYSG